MNPNFLSIFLDVIINVGLHMIDITLKTQQTHTKINKNKNKEHNKPLSKTPRPKTNELQNRQTKNT
jgi:hypothetical protein